MSKRLNRYDKFDHALRTPSHRSARYHAGHRPMHNHGSLDILESLKDSNSFFHNHMVGNCLPGQNNDQAFSCIARMTVKQ
jgi:hypothetical protein